MSDERQVIVNNGGMGTLLIFLVFLVLKLTGTVTWSWVWVTAPLWGTLGIVVVLWILFFAVVFLAALRD